jgi:hypothetical protein
MAEEEIDRQAAGGEPADDEGAEAPARHDETGLPPADKGAEA